MVTVTGKAVIGGTTYTKTADVTVTTPAGYPDATTTGTLVGTARTAYTGPTNITAANTTILNKNITSALTFGAAAHNGIIQNCLIKASAFYLILNDAGATNLQIINCELDGLNNGSGDCAVGGSNFTLSKVNIHGTVDGVKAGWDVIIKDSYIHDLTVTGTSHNDAIQSLGTNNLQILRNNLVVNAGANSSITLSTGSATDGMKNVLIDGNLVGGGGYSVYAGYQAGADILSRVSNIKVTNNKWSTSIYPNGGNYGPMTSADPPVILSNNTWYNGPKAGQPIW